MTIEVLGPGYGRCEALHYITTAAVAELGLDARVEKIYDDAEIARLGVMSTPALALDGRVLISGAVPSVKVVRSADRQHRMSVMEPILVPKRKRRPGAPPVVSPAQPSIDAERAERLASYAKALGDPIRVQLVDVLAEHPGRVVRVRAARSAVRPRPVDALGTTSRRSLMPACSRPGARACLPTTSSARTRWPTWPPGSSTASTHQQERRS